MSSDATPGRIAPVSSRTVWLGFLSALVCAGLLLIAAQQSHYGSDVPANMDAQLNVCRDNIMQTLKKTSYDIRDLDQITNHCVIQVSNSLSLADFNVRRLAFIDQYSESPFILWLVVIITLSGVVLAAIQIAAAYNVSAAYGRSLELGGKVDWEGTKLSVKSTVAGILILAMSFAFFLVFVIYVYTIWNPGETGAQPRLQATTATPNSSGPPQGVQLAYPRTVQPTAPVASTSNGK